MADASNTTATTQGQHEPAGFPPFDTTTFPSQFFWLAVTFAFLQAYVFAILTCIYLNEALHLHDHH